MAIVRYSKLNRMAIDPNSPMGYALTFLIVGFLVWWSLLRENKFTRPSSSHGYKKNWVYEGEHSGCPNCGSVLLDYDTLIGPTIAKCRDSKHEWNIIPRGAN